MSETRFEKFKKYRDQIQNKNELTRILITEEDQVTDYKKVINDLNPNILVDLQPLHLNFLNFTSIDKSTRKEIMEIRNFIDAFDFVLLSKIRDAANRIISQSSNDLYEEFEKKWITNDRGWIILNEDPAFVGNSSSEYLKYKEKLPASINRVKDLVNSTVRSNELEQLSRISVSFADGSANPRRKKDYFVVLAIGASFALILILLTILMLALI